MYLITKKNQETYTSEKFWILYLFNTHTMHQKKPTHTMFITKIIHPSTNSSSKISRLIYAVNHRWLSFPIAKKPYKARKTIHQNRNCMFQKRKPTVKRSSFEYEFNTYTSACNPTWSHPRLPSWLRKPHYFAKSRTSRWFATSGSVLL